MGQSGVIAGAVDVCGFIERESDGRHADIFSALQAVGIGLVADDGGHLRRQLAPRAGVEDGLQVAAVAGDQDDQPLHEMASDE